MSMPYRRCLAMPQVIAVDDQFGTHTSHLDRLHRHPSAGTFMY
jgi:hypothetical protein